MDVFLGWVRRCGPLFFGSCGFDLRSLALFRICLGLVLLTNLLFRLEGDGLVAFWTGEGVLPPMYPDPYLDVLSFFTSPAAVWVFFWGLFCLGVFFVVGFWSRLSAFLLFLGLVVLHYRAAAVEDGGDMVLRFFLLWASLLPVGARWSLDAWGLGGLRRGTFQSGWVFLFLMVLLSLHYFLNAVQKDWSYWTNPHLLYWVLADSGVASPLGVFLRDLLPFWVFSYGALGVLLVEGLLGVFLILGLFLPLFRLISAVLVLALHGSILVFLELGSFPLTYSAVAALLIPGSFWGFLGGTLGWGFLGVSGESRVVWRSWRGSLVPAVLFVFLLTLMSCYNPIFPRFFVSFSQRLHSWVSPVVGNGGVTCGWTLFARPPSAGKMWVFLGFKDGVWWDVSRGEVVADGDLEGYYRGLVGLQGRSPDSWLSFGGFFSGAGASYVVRRGLENYMFYRWGFTRWKAVEVFWSYSPQLRGPVFMSSRQVFEGEVPLWRGLDLRDVGGSPARVVWQDMAPFSGFSARGSCLSLRGESLGGFWPPSGGQILVTPGGASAFSLKFFGVPSGSSQFILLTLRVTGGPDFGRFFVDVAPGGGGRLSSYDGYDSVGVVPRDWTFLVPRASVSPEGWVTLYFSLVEKNPLSLGTLFGISGYYWGQPSM